MLVGCATPDYRTAQCAATECGPETDAAVRQDVGTAADAQAASPVNPSLDVGKAPVTDPSSSDAAASPSDAAISSADDGGVGKPAPPGVAQLTGRYAIRTRMYATDMPARATGFQQEFVWSATVRLDAASNELALDAALCSASWQIVTPNGTSNAVLAHPDKWPRRTLALHYENERFYTTGPSVAVGYDPTPPASCAGVSTAPRRDEQIWLGGAPCSCPQTADLPLAMNDCRIVDTDKDGRAGVTVQQQNVAGAFLVASRWLDATQLIAGVVRPDRQHTAEAFGAHNYYVLSCEPDLLLQCVNTAITNCPSAMQPVLFAPLTPRPDGADWTCAEIMSAYGAHSLFDSEPLAFPSACR